MFPAFLILFLGAAPPLGDRMGPYTGQPVLAVELTAPDFEDANALRDLVGIKPGFLLARSDIEIAVKRLYSLGRFSNVRVFGVRRSGTVTLHFVLEPTIRLGELEVVGLDKVDESDLRAGLGLRVGDEVDSQTQTKLISRSLSFLRSAGFPAARAQVSQETEGVLRTYVVSVDEGQPRRMVRVDFRGSPGVPRAALLRVMSLQTGSVIAQRRLDADRNALEEIYLKRGYRAARVDKAIVEQGPEGSVVIFNIESGTRQNIVFVGNSAIAETTLLALLPNRRGRIRPGDMELFTRRVERAYRKQGFPDATVEYRAGKRAGVLHHVLKIDQGEPLRIKKVVVEGSTAFDGQVLAKQIIASVAASLDDGSVLKPVEPWDAQGLTDGETPYGKPAEESPPARVPKPAERWVPELYDEALEGIRAIYLDRGYLDVVVGKPVLIREETKGTVTVSIKEGPQAITNFVRFKKNEAFDSARLLAALEEIDQTRGRPLTLGNPFSARAADDGRIELTRLYRDQGYLYANVFVKWHVNDTGTEASVEYSFEEGPRVHVRNVLIRGNEHTRESIIRGRVSLEPGSLYRLDQALGDQRAIASLGVFSDVRVKLIDEDRPSEQKDLVAEVAERDRQTVRPSVGLSTAEGVRGSLSYSYSNLFGTASSADVGLRFNRQVFFFLYGAFAETMRQRYDRFSAEEQVTKGIERDLRFGIRSPKFALPLDPSLRLDLFDSQENAIPYSLHAFGGIFGLDLEPHERVDIALEPSFSLKDLECPVEEVQGNDPSRWPQIPLADVSDSCLAAVNLRRSGGVIEDAQSQLLKFTPSVSLDLRDNSLNPRRGGIATLSATLATGRSRQDSDAPFRPVSFVRIQGQTAAYIPVGPPTFVLTVGGGTIRTLRGERVPVDERFFLGGARTLRGFYDRTLIPEDACVLSPDGDSTDLPPRCRQGLRRSRDSRGRLLPAVTAGGNTFVLAKAELRVPMTDNVSLDVFVDAGNLWVGQMARNNFDLRYSAGLGFRYNTPVGAIALDLGVNLFPRVENSEDYVPKINLIAGSF